MDRIQLQFTVKYITLIVGIIVTCVLTAVYIVFSWANVKVETIVAIVGSGFALTTLMYAAMNLQFLLKTEEEKLSYQKKKMAAHFVSEWNRPSMVRLTVVGSEVKVAIRNLPGDKVLEHLKDSRKEAAVVSILNYFERMELAIQHGLVDESFLREFFHLSVNGYYLSFKEYIAAKRQQLGSQLIFKGFETMAIRWSSASH